LQFERVGKGRAIGVFERNENKNNKNGLKFVKFLHLAIWYLKVSCPRVIDPSNSPSCPHPHPSSGQLALGFPEYSEELSPGLRCNLASS
jgi:hypothetical protein